MKRLGGAQLFGFLMLSLRLGTGWQAALRNCLASASMRTHADWNVVRKTQASDMS